MSAETIDRDGARLHFVDAGRGPVLLFVHGAPAWSYTWRNVVRRLESSFRCIAIDLPGFGRSPALPGVPSLDDYANGVRRFVERLDLADVTLVANDTGGPIGFRAASLAPERFSALVAIDTFAFALDDFAAVRAFLRLFSSAPLRALNRRLNLLPRAVTSFGTPAKRWDAGERAAYLEPFAARATRDRCISLLGMLARDRAFLAELERGLGALADRPLLSLFGERDHVRAFGFPERLARLFPRFTGHTIPAAGHFSHEDDPEAVATHILEWLAATRTPVANLARA